MIFDDRDGQLDRLVNVPEINPFFGIAEGKGLAAGARAACTTDAVYLGFGDVGQFIVDDVLQVLDVDTAGCDVGGNQDAGGAGFEVI